MENLPFYISLVFGLTVLAAVFIFYSAANHSKTFLLIITLWIIVQSIVGLSGFYRDESTIPPRFSLLVFPPLVMIFLLFITKKGKIFIDSLSMKWLAFFHIVRIPVELVLFWLFLNKMVPGLMTFEGRNFDVLSGISAPMIYYFVFVKKIIGPKLLLVWNFICLGLLLNVVSIAVLSLPTPFQQFAFEQPNVALLEFPFVLLPSVLVPLVLFAHLTAIRRLLQKPTDIVTIQMP